MKTPFSYAVLLRCTLFRSSESFEIFQDGVELCVDGERIIRFSVYDPTGQDHDVYVQHNNTDAVREFNAVRSAKNASL